MTKINKNNLNLRNKILKSFNFDSLSISDDLSMIREINKRVLKYGESWGNTETVIKPLDHIVKDIIQNYFMDNDYKESQYSNFYDSIALAIHTAISTNKLPFKMINEEEFYQKTGKKPELVYSSTSSNFIMLYTKHSDFDYSKSINNQKSNPILPKDLPITEIKALEDMENYISNNSNQTIKETPIIPKEISYETPSLEGLGVLSQISDVVQAMSLQSLSYINSRLNSFDVKDEDYDKLINLLNESFELNKLVNKIKGR